MYESCDRSEQCTGSFGANQCRYVAGIKMCHCQGGYSVFDGSCLKGNSKLQQQSWKFQDQCQCSVQTYMFRYQSNLKLCRTF